MTGSLLITERQTPDAGARHRRARTAGLLYAVVVVAGTFSLGYMPGRILGGDDIPAILARIQAQEVLFRWAIVAALACYTAFLVLPLALYRLLAPAGRDAAILMIAFAAASVPLACANAQHLYALLHLAGLYLAGGNGAAAQAGQELRAYDDGLLILQVFWGLWLLPFGYLASRASFLPALLGLVLIAAGLGYVADWVGQTAAPTIYAASGLGAWLLAPRTGEILICLWLLLAGARPLPRLRRSCLRRS
ncbi:uncharacterized protein DUF4386 [Nitrospirillum amazonense]|uniref:Uncharacterized protein DUF4386 n=1 Tax=Nitrospirillum amazonense TaxID=28077 RepID=A0A560EUG6_9PROT|nr:DUF4386 domain-containing protein [Nitrospirillum amazonense]TWB12987.1 uncharacterized protein DUF4386 [Nitrospirillum amazonense]